MRTKILVVGDSEAQREALAGFLAAQGCYAETAASGQEALRKLRPGIYDAVLLNDQLPDIDGVAVAALIGDLTPQDGRPRTICLTDTPGAMLCQRHGTQALFDAVVAKPWQPAALLAAVAQRPAPSPRSRRYPVSFQRKPSADDRCTPLDEPSPGRGRVLVVDDEPILRDVVQAVLAGQGHVVHVAADGLQALREMTHVPYDVVLLDLQMPHIDGLVAAKIVHDLQSRADRPRLIALTASCEQLHANECGSVSVFDAIIPKSAALSAVADAVARSLDYRSRPKTGEPIKIIDLCSLEAMLDPKDERLSVLDKDAFDTLLTLMPRPVVASNLRLLRDKIEAWRGTLDHASPGDTADDAAGHAHSMAGSAGLLGFKRLSDAASVYERALIGSSADLAAVTIRLRRAMETSLEEVDRILIGLADA